MLAVAERYAQGIVWADDHKEDHTQELEFLKGNCSWHGAEPRRTWENNDIKKGNKKRSQENEVPPQS